MSILGYNILDESNDMKILILQMSVFFTPSCVIAIILFLLSYKKLIYADMILTAEITMMIISAIIINHSGLVTEKNDTLLYFNTVIIWSGYIIFSLFFTGTWSVCIWKAFLISFYSCYGNIMRLSEGENMPFLPT